MAGGQDDQVTQSGNSPPATYAGAAPSFENLAPGSGPRGSPSAFGWQDGAGPGANGGEHGLPGLQDEERLPWLYSAEDERDAAGIDSGRVWAVVLTGFVLLALIVGGVWWMTHHRDGGQLADGSLITAPTGPIKVAPQDPGGKTFDGTGDSSFAVSQGHLPGVTLAHGAEQADGGAPLAAVGLPADAGVGAAAGGIGVQIGAFSTQLAAEAAWAHLAKSFDALSGAPHRIVEGKADIGTVYGLQAVAGSDAAANALCDRLKAAGLNCQVKD